MNYKELKYIRHSALGFVLWPKSDGLWHVDVARATKIRARTGHIVSAGFAAIENGVVRCWGRSESLDIGSQPGDADDLAVQFGLNAGVPAGVVAALSPSKGTPLPYSACGGPGSGAEDALYPEAVALVRKKNRGSISLVQRLLRIGYNRAAYMIEAMEKDGTITPRMMVNGQLMGGIPIPVVERKKPDDTEGGAE